MDDAGTLARWRTDKRFTVNELVLLTTPEKRARWADLDGACEAAREEIKRIRLESKTVTRATAKPRITPRA